MTLPAEAPERPPGNTSARNCSVSPRNSARNRSISPTDGGMDENDGVEQHVHSVCFVSAISSISA